MNVEVMTVLMYLFENNLQENYELQSERLDLVNELREAGFGINEINQALVWLQRLDLATGSLTQSNLKQSTSIRIYSDFERRRLNALCIGFLHFLQCLKILNPLTRELVVDCLFAMEGQIGLSEVKWAVLMVLFHCPEEKEALQLMEDLVLHEGTDTMQ